MGRERKGSIILRKRMVKDGPQGSERLVEKREIYARVIWKDPATGVKHDVQKRAKDRTQARMFIKRMLRDIEDNGRISLDKDAVTFPDLATYYQERYLIPAQYVDGRKVAGMRSYKDGLLYLRVLKEFFGKRLLRTITFGDLEHFKARRLATPTFRGQQRSIAFVNRELTLLRRMFNVAVREKMMPYNPFSLDDSLISAADEKRRERILTKDEELRLLAACTGVRAHLKPLIVGALDTGCRQGELFKLRWRDVNFEDRTIVVQAMNTKTLKARLVPISSRFMQELEALKLQSIDQQDGLVFGVTNNVKRSWDSVRRTAGLPGLRFHDLRHSFATRLVSGNLPLAQVGNILGHSIHSTTLRYVNTNRETLDQSITVIDAYHQPADTAAGDELVN